MMIFKGHNYRLTKKVIKLPSEHWHGAHKNYVAFGRICSKKATGAIQTTYFWKGDVSPFGTDEGNRVYAVRVTGEKYSLTNLLYADDGYAYLAYDGRCYIRSMKLMRRDAAARR